MSKVVITALALWTSFMVGLGDFGHSILAAKSTVQEGTTVFRVWGDEAGAWGRSWTTVDPRTVPGCNRAEGVS